MLRTFVTATALVALLVGMGACKKKAASKSDSPKQSNMEGAKESEPSAATKDTAPKVKPGKKTEKTPVSSCDQRKKKGLCTDAFKAAWSVGEKQVKSNCSRGVFAKTPCPSEGLLGYCSMGPAYRVAFYSGTSRNYDQAKAAGLCKSFYSGKYAAK